MHKPGSVLKDETHKILWNFKKQTDHLIPARRLYLVLTNKNCYLVDFTALADHRVKIKESEKIDKYLDLARERGKKLCDKNVIPIVVSALGTVPKGLEKKPEEFGIRGKIETIQTTALLKSAGIIRSVLETWGNLLSSQRPSALADVKNSQGINW